jgi:hypothetical protein
MRKTSGKPTNDDLRPEYDLSKLKGGVRGKYYRQAKAGTNLVLIESDLAQAFPGEDSVNRALRLLLTTAKAATAEPGRKSKSRPGGRLRAGGPALQR